MKKANFSLAQFQVVCTCMLGEACMHTMDPVLSHHTYQGRQPAAVPELPNDQPHQSPKQSHAEDLTEQVGATGGEDYC